MVSESSGSWILLVAFGLMIVVVAKSPHFPLKGGSRSFAIDFGIAPLVTVGLLLITGIIQPDTIVRGLLGNPPLEPYTIMLLFFCQAYICVSLDATGVFAYIALKAVRATRGDGRRLFNMVFLLSSVLTLVTSNDIVILTLTPIILHIGKTARVKVTLYLFAQFFTANVWSMMFLVGNPTDIIVGVANGIDFLEYLRWMALPTACGGIACYGLLRGIFRRDLGVTFALPELEPTKELRTRGGAIFGSSILLANLVTLALSPFFPVQLWQIIATYALVLVVHDLLRDVLLRRSLENFPRFQDIAGHLPWKIMSFVFSLFVLVEALAQYGWIEYIAASFNLIADNVLLALLGMACYSTTFANLMNNQPMTIFFTRGLQSSSLTAGLDSSTYSALTFGLIIGSNLGANVTLFGALAGLMWAKIIREKGETLVGRIFVKYGLLVTPIVLLVTCLPLFFFLA